MVLGLLIFDVFNEIFLRGLLIFNDIGEGEGGGSIIAKNLLT